PVSETSEPIRDRVMRARKLQRKRFAEWKGIYCNAQIPPQDARSVCRVGREAQALLKSAMERLQLSARSYDRILKVARTIADLAGSPDIATEHIAEAIHFRALDRGNWK